MGTQVIFVVVYSSSSGVWEFLNLYIKHVFYCDTSGQESQRFLRIWHPYYSNRRSEPVNMLSLYCRQRLVGFFFNVCMAEWCCQMRRGEE